jgi:hypothetical protein
VATFDARSAVGAHLEVAWRDLEARKSELLAPHPHNLRPVIDNAFNLE